MAMQTYSSVPQAGSPSHSEAWALTEAARRIAIALEKAAEADDLQLPAAKRELRDAIRLNWRLWTIFQAELTLDTNPVPMDVRQNMLTLCQFVDNHTIACMTDLDPEKIKTLIDINRNIAQGLLEGAANAPRNPASQPGAPASAGLNTDA
ncbi:MAG: flagellar biosynthesis regulator FlaF [Alphaproteobacteria bacterium]|nr:flagellar biosynthesis regulator FlaF [Alphaproteobacteria bacterium]MBF0249295.1 flagellar biosynthesis regulator FlaF [Alphaproteobacteria bacterium]